MCRALLHVTRNGFVILTAADTDAVTSKEPFVHTVPDRSAFFEQHDEKLLVFPPIRTVFNPLHVYDEKTNTWIANAKRTHPYMYPFGTTLHGALLSNVDAEDMVDFVGETYLTDGRTTWCIPQVFHDPEIDEFRVVGKKLVLDMWQQGLSSAYTLTVDGTIRQVRRIGDSKLLGAAFQADSVWLISNHLKKTVFNRLHLESNQIRQSFVVWHAC